MSKRINELLPLIKNCILKEDWQGGHHRQFLVDQDTGAVVADAYEIYHISHAEHESRKECRASLLLALSHLFGTVLTNRKSGIKARFSKNTANKIASDKAITKSVVNGFSVEDHFEAAENIRQIFELAEFVGTFSDMDDDPNILAIHRFQQEIILSGGRKCVAYITLKQVKKDGSRIYTQELLLKKYPLHEAGELTSRGFERSETTAYKCSPRTKTTIAQTTVPVNGGKA